MRPAALLRALAFSLAVAAAPSASADNFLIVLLDDVGVDKIGAYRDGECVSGECPAPPPTPEIDALAAEGLLFRNAWATPVCSSTRAALLTGRHGFRSGIGHALVEPYDHPGLDPEAPNLANALKTNGYDTAAFGKWHMEGCASSGGVCTGAPSAFGGHPIQAGFDYFAGSASNLPPPNGYCGWTKTVSERTGPGAFDFTTSTDLEPTYATVDTVDEVIARVPQMSEPWLAWVAFNAPHSPIHWPPADPQNCWNQTSGTKVARYDATLAYLDAEIGRMLTALRADPEVYGRTTVILLGDNGTLRYAVVPPFLFQRSKLSIYEGGVNVPFIVTGPHLAPASEGTESAQLVAGTDVFSTVMEIAGLAPCGQGSECGEDSVSLLPHLMDPIAPTRALVFSEIFFPLGTGYPDWNRRAVRNATHKLIRADEDGEAALELYALQTDPFEQNDLLDALPLDATAQTAFAELGAELSALHGYCIALDDTDSDCVIDAVDNCQRHPNGPLEAGVPSRGNQTDVDGDGIGDACDPDDDTDDDDDDDGIDDVFETNTGLFVGPTNTGTDPQLRDTDGDLVGDHSEILAGSDPTDPDSVPSVFTEPEAFLEYAPAAPYLIDFDIQLHGTVLSGGTLYIPPGSYIGVTFPPGIANLLDPPGPFLVDAIVVEDSGSNPAVSGTHTLGVGDLSNGYRLRVGMDFALSFPDPIRALALSVVSEAAPNVELQDQDLKLVASSGETVGLHTADRMALGTFGGSEYYRYFLGVTSPTGFSSVTLQRGEATPEAAFAFNVDNVQVAPEPDALSLLGAGGALLGWLARRRNRRVI